MEMAEFRPDGVWEIRAYESAPGGSYDPELWLNNGGRLGPRRGRRRRPDGRAPPPRRPLGWSLVIAATANVLLALVAIVTGAAMVGVVACGFLGLSSWLLVVAEVIAARRC